MTWWRQMLWLLGATSFGCVGIGDGGESPMPNRLIHEQSPYLLQHAYNPVDWHPWGEESFAKAREEDKPIFLSIGYSTCHWCHVMASESFEDPGIAEILNRDFIAIKVDREERPDIDRIYMSFVQATSGQGGWPLNVWLTPDLEPFSGGTYYPPRDAHGRPGFNTVLLRIAEAWQQEREKIIEHGGQIVASLSAAASATTETGLVKSLVESECLDEAYGYFDRAFDPAEGGFGLAPKFPRPVVYEFLFDYAHRKQGSVEAERAVEMALFSLRKIAAGGIADHLGGGFHRYAVDGEWHVPHFEKMLYDQAQLARVYLIAYQISGDSEFADVARGIFRYIARDMTAPEGGFYSAEDAVSLPEKGANKKREGAFYVWSWQELKETLDRPEFEVFTATFDVRENGNVAPLADPHGELQNKNVLIQRKSREAVVEELDSSEDRVNALLVSAREKLLRVRERRPPPHRDDKMITAWNGMMVSALCKGYLILGEGRYLTDAKEAVAFVHRELATPEQGILQRSFRQKSSGISGFAEDYAFWIRALIDLYETTGEIDYLRKALRFQESMDEIFWDNVAGGYFSSSGSADVIIRMKDDHDGAEPSANSVAALNLARLADMLQREDLRERSQRVLRGFAATLERSPAELPLMLNAVAWHQGKPAQIVLAGEMGKAGANFSSWRQIASEEFRPAQVLLTADGDEGQKWLVEQGAPIGSFAPVDGMPTAYVCQDYMCQLPTNDLDAFRRMLEQSP